MRFNLVSSFAAGIFLTTSILAGVYFTSKNDVAKADLKSSAAQPKVVTAQPSENEMKDKLVSAGYIVQKKADYDKMMKKAKSSGTKAAAPTADNQSQKVVYRAVVNVSEGMTSIDVGNMLEQAKIVPNAFNFSKDIESRGLENGLRPGTFVVDSGMTYDQVIATIFKK